MFTIGFMLMFILAYSESINMKKIAGAPEVKNVMTLIIAVTGFLVAQIVFLINNTITGESINFIKELHVYTEWSLYAAVGSQFVGTLLARKNYEVNGSNITAINFSLFFSLSIVPIIAYFCDDFFGFKDTLQVDYKSSKEFLIFVGLMSLLTVLYFFDKLKTKINNIYWLLPYPFVLSSSIYFSTKTMQSYNAFFAYSAIVSFLIVLFLINTIKAKEFKNLKKPHLKLVGFLVISWSIAIPANTIAIKILAVEFVTMLKRLCQILAGVILDIYYKNNINFHYKDKYIIGLMFILCFTLYYFRA